METQVHTGMGTWLQDAMLCALPGSGGSNPLTDTVLSLTQIYNCTESVCTGNAPPSLTLPAAVNHQPTQTRLHQHHHRLSALIGVDSMYRVPPFYLLLTVTSLIITGPTPSIFNPSFLFPSALLLQYF